MIQDGSMCQCLMHVILATQEAEISRIVVQSQPGQIVPETLSGKYPSQGRAGNVAQVVEQLPSKCEALNSNSSITHTLTHTHPHTHTHIHTQISCGS
jgi:hypothetical protein